MTQTPSATLTEGGRACERGGRNRDCTDWRRQRCTQTRVRGRPCGGFSAHGRSAHRLGGHGAPACSGRGLRECLPGPGGRGSQEEDRHPTRTRGWGAGGQLGEALRPGHRDTLPNQKCQERKASGGRGPSPQGDVCDQSQEPSLRSASLAPACPRLTAAAHSHGLCARPCAERKWF